MVVYPIGSTKACQICAEILHQCGTTIVDHPTPDVTHIMLDVPSFSNDGSLRNGGSIETILPMLPENIVAIGGNLIHPALMQYKCVDLLRDEIYLVRNAAITADCAVKVVSPWMDFVFQDCPVLILGWGRIGKCLAKLLRSLGCRVTVAARKGKDRALLEAMGYRALDFPQAEQILGEFRIVFNTVPEKIIEEKIPAGSIGVELASNDGIQGENVVVARGLPGRLAPVSAGKLMADTVFRLYQEEQL